MSNVLVIIPSKGRPQNIPPLLEGIRRTAIGPVDVELVVDNSEVGDYVGFIENIAPPAGATYSLLPIEDEKSSYPNKLNWAAQVEAANSEGHDYLVLMNDDHMPITNGWDVAMKDALKNDLFGIAYGPDGIWEDGRIPSCPMITKSMFEALGWIALPGLNHILVDNVWWDISEAMGTRHFLPDVRIQHSHYTMGTAPKDATYEETSHQGRQDEDSKTYWDWRNNGGIERAVAQIRGENG